MTSPVFCRIVLGMPGVSEFIAEGGCTAVLPDDGVVDGLTGLTIPDDCRLALIGDSDSGDVCAVDVHLGHGLGRDTGLTRPDLVRIVLDPAALREDLPELLLSHRANLAILIDDQRAGTGGALIERQDVLRLSHTEPLVFCR